MRLSALKFVPLLLLLAITLPACDTEDPYAIPPPDFSTVPEPFAYEDAEPEEVEEGVEIYVLDEGDGTATVQPRDQIVVYITLRTVNSDGDDEVIYSSFANDDDRPVSFSIREIVRQPTSRHEVVLAFTEGLKKGLLDMQEGERRTIIVSPEKGYQGVSETNPTHQYSDDTLQYDITLSAISY